MNGTNKDSEGLEELLLLNSVICRGGVGRFWLILELGKLLLDMRELRGEGYKLVF